MEDAAPSDSSASPETGQTKPATTSSIQEEISRLRVEREMLSRMMEPEKMEERLRQQMVNQKAGRVVVEPGVTTKDQDKILDV
jgi:hypothetical protein